MSPRDTPEFDDDPCRRSDVWHWQKRIVLTESRRHAKEPGDLQRSDVRGGGIRNPLRWTPLRLG